MEKIDTSCSRFSDSKISNHPLFNGNIAETFWKTSTDNVQRKYNYKYDDLNRLLQADYSKQGSTEFNSYLEHLTYDKNGNIQTLLRNGNRDTDGFQFENPIDNLTYLYDDTNKNQLLRVFDATANQQGFVDDTDGMDINQDIEGNPDYAYDDNGNMTRDDNKGITNITYNHLNLPVIIYFGGDNNIEYLYNATGQKVSKKVIQDRSNITTDYLSGFQYKNTVLQFFPQAEGYVNATQNELIGGGTSYTFNYVYNYTDHLGNIRLSYSQDPSTNVLKVIEENHYYPFGLKHTGYNSDQMLYVKEASVLKIKPMPPLFKTSYNYKYNGKELQEELGLNFYDYGARNYDPALGRWMNVDPLAEKYPSISPYAYVANNPINAIDPDGRDIIFLIRNNDGTVKEQLKYRNGNFWHSNGKRYNPGKESLSPTMYKVLSSYRKIEESNDKVLKSQLHKLETSKEKHYVEKSPNGENAVSSLRDDKSYFGEPASTQTEFDFDVNTDNDPLKTVVHEMRHQFDHDIGNMQDNKRGSDASDPAEIRAVHNENRANDILGEKHRTTYAGKKIDPEKLKNPPNNKQVNDVKM